MGKEDRRVMQTVVQTVVQTYSIELDRYELVYYKFNQQYWLYRNGLLTRKISRNEYETLWKTRTAS